MNKEDKESLLKDLCCRLPYGVKCKYYDCCKGDYDSGTICGFERKEFIQIDGVCIHVEEVKPYLFPLSSMTAKQKQKYYELCIEIGDISEEIDYLTANHFDYRGLIEKGLAIDATGLNVY